MRNESGRSMLEMIAVMAIAGLLGIGSVEGYQAAVRKNQTNEILEEANQRALSIAHQLALDKDIEEIELGEFPTDVGRGTTFPKKPKKLNDEFFSIPVTGLDEPSCEQLQSAAGGALRRVDCIPENGSVRADLIYHKELSEDAGDLSAVEIGHSGAGTAATRRYDNNKEDCEKNGYQYCADDICITKEETCKAGSPLCAGEYPGTSEHNSGGYAGEVEGKTCRCPDNQVFNHDEKKCIAACSGHGSLTPKGECECQTGYSGAVCETECSGHGSVADGQCVCGKGYKGESCDTEFRCVHGSLNDDNTCTCDGDWKGDLCDLQCPTGAGVADTTVDGVSYSGADAGLASDGTTQCKCPSTTPYWNGTACQETAVCSGHGIMTDGVCVCDSGWYGALCDSDSFGCDGVEDNYGKCYSCFSERSISSSSDECDKCSNREMINNSCVLKEDSCNSLGGFRTSYNTCQLCDNTSPISVSDCDKCNNTPYRREVITNNLGYEVCALTSDVCHALFPEGGFRSISGYCTSCSSRSNEGASQTECNLCSNREMITVDGKNRCVPSSAFCATAYPEGGFRQADGSCQKCSSTSRHLASPEDCARCDNTDYPRKMITYLGEEYCVTSAACPTGYWYFKGDDGVCYTCTYTSYIPTSPEECARCDNSPTKRTMENGVCKIAQDCSGHGTRTYGNCVCDAGYIGTYCETENVCSGGRGLRIRPWMG